MRTSSSDDAQLGRWTLCKKLGEGATSRVYLGVDRKTNEKAAIKLFRTSGKQTEEFMKQEASILNSLSHENIIRYKETFANYKINLPNGRVSAVSGIAMECAAAEFFDLFKENGRFPEKLARTYFWQIIKALDHMHTKNIIHRDIKPDNLLIDREFNIKIADFGAATKVDPTQPLTISRGTSSYFAPEIHKKQPFSGFGADIFAAGMLLFCMVTGHMPFIKAIEGDKVYDLLMAGDERGFWNLHQRIMEEHDQKFTFNKEFKDLMIKMLAPKPSDRLDIEDIKCHPWMQREVCNEEEIAQLLKIIKKGK